MKFGIDLGHGVGMDRGAVGNIAEETIINKVGTKVISKLKSLGHTVIQLRPSSAYSVNNSLIQRYTKANDNNVDLCVSIHANAGGGVGTEVFTYNAKEVKQARAVLNNIVALGFRNRGIKDGSGLAMVKRPKATAMLIEICFIDTSDSDLYNSIGAESIANAIVTGLTGQAVCNGEWLKGTTPGNTSKWWYKHPDGSYTKNNWEKINGEWYFFDEEGWMVTGWLQSPYSGKWYYMYYDTGTMAHDTEINGYKIDSNGVATKM